MVVRPQIQATLLTIIAGITDAVGYITMGGVFAAKPIPKAPRAQVEAPTVESTPAPAPAEQAPTTTPEAPPASE